MHRARLMPRHRCRPLRYLLLNMICLTHNLIILDITFDSTSSGCFSPRDGHLGDNFLETGSEGGLEPACQATSSHLDGQQDNQCSVPLQPFFTISDLAYTVTHTIHHCRQAKSLHRCIPPFKLNRAAISVKSKSNLPVSVTISS